MYHELSTKLCLHVMRMALTNQDLKSCMNTARGVLALVFFLAAPSTKNPVTEKMKRTHP